MRKFQRKKDRVKPSLVSLTRPLKIRVIPVFQQSLRTSLKCPRRVSSAIARYQRTGQHVAENCTESTFKFSFWC